MTKRDNNAPPPYKHRDGAPYDAIAERKGRKGIRQSLGRDMVASRRTKPGRPAFSYDVIEDMINDLGRTGSEDTMKKKRASGGAVAGTKTPGRLDRARGGRTGKATTVNVVVAPQGGGAPPPMPMPPMPPPAPPGPPMGGPPPGGPPMPGMYRGGAVKMKAGAGGGLGRLEKQRRYGSNAKS